MKSTMEGPGIRAGRGSLIAIGALIGAMIADLVETAVDPANSGDGASFFAAAAHHHDRMVASAVLLLASGLLLVPGVLGIARMLRARGRRLGLGGAGLALLGGAGHVALAAVYLVFATIPTAGLPPAHAVALIDHIVNSGDVMLLAPLAIAFPLAILVTLIATVRGGLVAPRMLLLIAAAPVAAAVAPGPDAVKTSCALILFLGAGAAVFHAARSTVVTVRAV